MVGVGPQQAPVGVADLGAGSVGQYDDAVRRFDLDPLPGVGEGGIRFYAGYPLYGPGGHAVGTFCIYDSEPRKLADGDVETLAEIAAWAQRELESFDDLERASAVQRQLQPRSIGDLDGYAVCALCLPAYAVGGDFYDHHRVRDGAVFTVADVMGKGMGAAIIAASARAVRSGSMLCRILAPDSPPSRKISSSSASAEDS